MEIKKVGVVGCGQMGGGIVQVSAQAGYQVVVSEVREDLLKKGLAVIEKNLSRNVEKGRMTEQEKADVMGRIKGTVNLQDFAGCDLVIEAAVENLDLKRKIFADLDKIVAPHALLASNTSCLSIVDMAMATGRPDKVVGLHFFNPVPMMKLIEIVRTITTSDETMELSKEFGTKVGKTIVLMQDEPGFIVNRLLIPYLLNAIRLLESGSTTKEDIDTAINLGLNHPMGPLTLADLIGLDTVQFIANGIYEELKDPWYVSPTLLKNMVKAGWLGRKTGKGFYEYK